MFQIELGDPVDWGIMNAMLGELRSDMPMTWLGMLGRHGKVLYELARADRNGQRLNVTPEILNTMQDLFAAHLAVKNPGSPIQGLASLDNHGEEGENHENISD